LRNQTRSKFRLESLISPDWTFLDSTRHRQENEH
jgi:hypothetical protein